MSDHHDRRDRLFCAILGTLFITCLLVMATLMIYNLMAFLGQFLR